jgi:hypothetical protein
MVVDIQGVSDLYTDPQLHTVDLSGGEGDLGAMGMAYFLASFDHDDNAIAYGRDTGLAGTVADTPRNATATATRRFPLSPAEQRRIEAARGANKSRYN